MDLPDDISQALAGQGVDLKRQTLETIAVEGYRMGALTENPAYDALRFCGRFAVSRFGAAVRIASIADRRTVFTASED